MFKPVRAPEIAGDDLTWFNVPEPLSLGDLRGKLVILDFWTFCCINCLHVIPSLRQVEERFPEAVAVIGVHSPKFAAERVPENLAHAIARYGIGHPVIHDPELRLWKAYAVRAWPTLVFISPDGYVVGQHAGEPDPGAMIDAIGRALAEYEAHGAIDRTPLPAKPVEVAAGRLRFPGKIKPLPGGTDGRRWILADSGRNQIVLLDDDGAELGRYGSGERGLADGAPMEARFDAPQGLIGGTDAIYVADTGNHAIRRIDLGSGRVTTLAGTGRRGGGLLPEWRPGAELALASVWDLELSDGRLFFANAGSHQLGVLDLDAGAVRLLAGSGRENIVDGPAEEAQLAQPSGLALNDSGDVLYFADSETSSIRFVTLDENPDVTTLVGTGLFDFGHRNGSFLSARLQHPLGVAWWNGRIVVADSYNSALRVLDLGAGQVGDLDEELSCQDPLCLPLAEPAGVSVAGPQRLLVADTNNHRILEYRLDDGTYRTWAA